MELVEQLLECDKSLFIQVNKDYAKVFASISTENKAMTSIALVNIVVNQKDMIKASHQMNSSAVLLKDSTRDRNRTGLQAGKLDLYL